MHISSRPYLGDVGAEIAAHLPGRWTSELEVYSHPFWQGDLVPLLWDAGELSGAVCDERVPYAVVLKEPSGTELLLIERPAHQDYLVGALMTKDYERNYDAPFAPASIALGSSPGAAARDIAHRFLPAYRRALHQRRLATVSSALATLRAEHRAPGPGAAGISPTGGTGPLDRPEEQGSFEGRLWLPFHDVLVHAPAVLEQCDAAASNWPADGAALARLREALTAGQPALGEWNAQMNSLVRTPPVLRESPSGFRARLELQAMPAIEAWLAEGDAFVRQALAATPGRTLALPPGRGPAPSPAAAPPKRR